MTCDGEPTIFIDRDLRGHEKTKCAWHEIGHYLFHPGGIHGHYGQDGRVDVEADVVAVCAMVPRTLLGSLWLDEIMGEYGYPPSLIEFRREILAIWRI
jgi:Zn-dependent peptidase ImmA (M78 family)